MSTDMRELGHLNGGLCTLGPDVDLRDATAVLDAIRAAARVRDTYPAAAHKAIREAITHYWACPRVPDGPKVSGQYPESLLWSQTAYQAWEGFEKKKRGPGRRQSQGNGLRLEHLMPLGLVREHIIEHLDQYTPETMRDFLIDHHRTAALVIVTVDEDKALDKHKLRSTTPDPDDLWKRYRLAGIEPEKMKVPNPGSCRCPSSTS